MIGGAYVRFLWERLTPSPALQPRPLRQPQHLIQQRFQAGALLIRERTGLSLLEQGSTPSTRPSGNPSFQTAHVQIRSSSLAGGSWNC